MSRNCAHQELEHLGNDRDARFLRCEDCGAVFVLQGGEAWGVPAIRRRSVNPLH